jgi:IS5 family transposase
VNWYLDSKGIRITTGTIVDAPSSTDNSTGERDPEVHRTKKGNQWHFGAKAHIGVDSKEGVAHSVCTSAASVHNKHMLPDLLHGEEKKVWGDAGCSAGGVVSPKAGKRPLETQNAEVQNTFIHEIDAGMRNRSIKTADNLNAENIRV